MDVSKLIAKRDSFGVYSTYSRPRAVSPLEKYPLACARYRAASNVKHITLYVNAVYAAVAAEKEAI